MPSVIDNSTTLSQRAKSAIERMGCALLSSHTGPCDFDVDRLSFELRVVLQRVLILDRVGLLEGDLEWGKLLDLDLELQLFPEEQLPGDRIWSGDWVGLVRREFGLCGGKWFAELVEFVRADSAEMGAVDESLMGWGARVEDGAFVLVAEEGSERKVGGVFYTPASLVGYVLDRALMPAIERCGSDVDLLLGLRVCDPACGCGYFLIEAGRRIAERIESLGGGDRRCDVWRSCLIGGDVNPLTAEICRWLLWFEAGDRSLTIDELRGRVVCGDSLIDEGVFDGGFDVVVGNPPFLNQLGSGTARSKERVAKLRELGLVGSATYTDEASAFFVLGLKMAKDGGRVCMVQPQSVMATRGGAHARKRAGEMGWLESVWVSNEHVFGDASVYTCAPCVVVGQTGDQIERYSTGKFVQHSTLAMSGDVLRSLETWSSISAVTMGVPEIGICSSGVVGDIATATADFRDEYYGLADNIVDELAEDAGGGVALLTTGLVDLGRCWWGSKATRILKQRWESPRVKLGSMGDDARLSRWVEARAVEKILAATQTKVVEALVDAAGLYAAVTPMISVMVKGGEDTACRPPTRRSSRGTLDNRNPDCAEDGESGHPSKMDVWMVGAAIGSPVCSMFAMRFFGGAAMHADALKMSARQVLELPLPVDYEAWKIGAEAFERVHSVEQEGYGEAVSEFGEAMCGAYGVVGEERDELMGWWLGRLGIG